MPTPTISGSPCTSLRPRRARPQVSNSSSGSGCATKTAIPRSTPAQLEAIGKWGVQREGSYGYLKTIKQPALVVNGSSDVIIYPINSFILQQNIPNAQLILYPDSNHGAHYQYPELFVRHASMFLDS